MTEHIMTYTDYTHDEWQKARAWAQRIVDDAEKNPEHYSDRQHLVLAARSLLDLPEPEKPTRTFAAVPDTTTLRNLLEEATFGPWLESDPSGFNGQWRDILSLDDDCVAGAVYAPDARLIVLAPELAAEVIRLREDLYEYMTLLAAGEIYNSGKDRPFTKHQVNSLIFDLARILEGVHHDPLASPQRR